MDDPAGEDALIEHGVVVKALAEGLGGAVEWDDRGARLVRADRDLKGLTPEFIRRKLIRHVRRNGGQAVKQKRERREWHRDEFDFGYEIIVPARGFRHGIYVEVTLTDADPEVPAVTIVRAHPELKRIGGFRAWARL